MARARSLKPGFFHDIDLIQLPPLARLLFAGLWCYADRDGRLLENQKQIKHDILPEDRCDVGKLLDLLSSPEHAFILRYEVEGKRYIQIRTFTRHQNPHKNEPSTSLPSAYCSASSLVPLAPKFEDSLQNPRTLVQNPSTRASSLNPLPLTLNPEPSNGTPAVDGGMLDPNLTQNDPGYWAERWYERHPKKKNLPLVQGWCARHWQQHGEPLTLFGNIDVAHAAWCLTEGWMKENGNYAPKLDEWLVDRGWTKMPQHSKPKSKLEEQLDRIAAQSANAPSAPPGKSPKEAHLELLRQKGEL